MTNDKTVNETMIDYANYVGYKSIQADDPSVKDYFDYIVTPEEYIERIFNQEKLPSKEVIREFLGNFYKKEEVQSILKTYNWNNISVVN